MRAHHLSIRKNFLHAGYGASIGLDWLYHIATRSLAATNPYLDTDRWDRGFILSARFRGAARSVGVPDFFKVAFQRRHDDTEGMYAD